jgi:cell division protein FtsL
VRDEIVVRLGKPVDNSRVVRQVDPRSRREVLLLIVLGALLAAGLGLYAWPALEIRRASQAGAVLDQERERLVRENRELHLEKASLEDLKRVEAIAKRQIGLVEPAPERTIVIEVGRPRTQGEKVAGEKAPRREARTAKPPEVQP